MSTRLDVVVSAIAGDSGLDPDNVAQDKKNIIRWINETRRELYELPVKFSNLEFSGELVGVANVTAGTVKATLNASEVTGTTTSFATAMAGRYIQIGTTPWQRVSYVSDTTHLTLESGWNSDTTTGQSYKIWKRDYALPPKVYKVIEFRDLADPSLPLAYYDHYDFQQRYGFGDSFSYARTYTQFGVSEMGEAFLGSTVFTGVSVTANSPIADFSGTGLVTAMAPGDRLRIGNSTTATAFYVDRVLTDIKVALRSFVPLTNSSLSATAFSMDRTLVQFYPAIDNTRVYLYKARKRFADLVADSDFLEDGWYSVTRKGGVAKSMSYVRDPREVQKLAEFEAEVKNLIRSQHRAHNPAPRLQPYIGNRYGNTGIAPSDRDAP